MDRNRLVAVPSRTDIALAAVVGGGTLLELHTSWAFERVPLSGPTWVHYTAVVVANLLLAWRRVHPLLVAPLVLAVFAGQFLLSEQPNIYGELLTALIAAFATTAYGGGKRVLVSIVASLGLAFLLGLPDQEDPVGVAVTNVVVGLIVFGLGAVVRRARERADLMQAQRDVADRRAAAIAWEERERIARELHDVVAHGMSVVVLQARGGRRMLDAEPIRAARAFDDIERVASSCLDEMRRLVGILRAREPGTAPLAPQPKLAEVGALVEQAQASGAVVDLVVTGQQRELTPALELAGYRIAQEALTNALKHAPGSTTRVEIRYNLERLEISVEDDGPGAAPAGTGGHGLVGMRERAELYGGTFHAGSEPGSGFHVNATLPLNGSEP